MVRNALSTPGRVGSVSTKCGLKAAAVTQARSILRCTSAYLEGRSGSGRSAARCRVRASSAARENARPFSDVFRRFSLPFDQAIKGHREAAHANTGGVPDGVRGRARRAGDADLAHALDAERVDMRNNGLTHRNIRCAWFAQLFDRLVGASMECSRNVAEPLPRL